MTTSPLLWYLNRGTGIVLLLLMTLTTVLGVLATARTFHPSWPRFVTQSLHRALAGTSVLLLVVHAVSAVVDEFVDIRWWQALVPWGATYQPLYLSIGTLALDLVALVVVTSLPAGEPAGAAVAGRPPHQLRRLGAVGRPRTRDRHRCRPAVVRPAHVELCGRRGCGRRGAGHRYRPRPRREPGVTTASVVGPLGEVLVAPGPLLLAGVASGSGLTEHTARLGPAPEMSLASLLELTRAAGVRGRGGAGFPISRKLETAARGRRPVVVVNAAEGEPASAKDLVLLALTPHQVLDGAVVVARALAAKEIHVVTSADRPAGAAGVDAALRERSDRGIRWRRHVAAPRFVAGQGRAVLELMAGREGLPVTAWEPEAVRGHRGRPTLLSNAETFAQVGALARIGAERYAAHGTATEPGTTLLTIAAPEPGAPTRVVEVAHGTPFAAVLDARELAGPCLVGGYHGTWTSGEQLAALPVSALALRAHGITLGAGVVLPLGARGCPVARTADLTAYLAAESAGRCGPCRNGLPALAAAVRELASGVDSRPRVAALTGLVTGRGACAHPDGTTRLVGSLVHGLPALVEDHLAGRCACRAPAEDVA